MRRLRLPISDRVLRRWLDVGKPKRVERRLRHDHALEDRIRSLTDLDERQLDAITAATAPPKDLIEATTHAVRQEIADHGLVSTIGGLLGLGMRTAEALIAPREPLTTERGDSQESEDSS